MKMYIRTGQPSQALIPRIAPKLTKALRTIVVVLLALGAPRTFASVHPVPLDKNTDAAKCLECHVDKDKGKSVHSAMAMGCTSCHEVRVTKDVTRVKLTTSTPSALCLTCHADHNAADAKGKVHPPAVRDCVKCHDPHESDNKNQLLKPTSGDKDQNLCLSCHTQGLNVPEKGSRHAALDMDAKPAMSRTRWASAASWSLTTTLQRRSRRCASIATIPRMRG